MNQIFKATYFLAVIATSVCAQIPENFKMVNASVTKEGQLIIKPSATSSKQDFDFLAGNWSMDNKRLKTRLNNSTEWIEYKSSDENYGPVLNGIANVDIFKAAFNQVNETPYEGLTLRIFNPKTKLWSLYWVDSNVGILDPPVVGSFMEASEPFIVRIPSMGKQFLSCSNGIKLTRKIRYGVRLFLKTMATAGK